MPDRVCLKFACRISQAQRTLHELTAWHTLTWPAPGIVADNRGTTGTG
jgi:hypothetical protein